MTQLKLDMLDNALDFLEDAVEQLSEESLSARHVKYSILHLWSAIELLLKQRLLAEHWSLVVADIDKLKGGAFAQGDFTSVTFDQAKDRLRTICDIDFSKYSQLLGNLKALRNKIEHYHMDTTRDQAVALLVKAWAFVLEFVSDLESILSEDAQTQFGVIRSKMVVHEDFVKSRNAQIEKKLKGIEWEGVAIIDCPECFQNALSLHHKDNIQCLFCNYRFTWNELINQLFAEGPFRCPECYGEGLYQFNDGGMYPPNPGWVCVECGLEWEWNGIVICDRCGYPMPRNPERSICSDCWQDILSQE